MNLRDFQLLYPQLEQYGIEINTDAMQLANYGFVYHRDLDFPQDDITWVLLEKSK